MEQIQSIAFLLGTVIVYLIIAVWASRGVKSKDSYLLGNRNFGIWSITLTIIATQVGAGMIFGTAAESYLKGPVGIAYVLGMVLGLVVLGLGVGARLRSLNISTAAELFETKYGSKTLRKIAAIISILTMGGILAAQIVASRQLFATLFTISPFWLAVFWITIIGYTTFGGLKAIIATDIFQVIMIVIVFTAVLFYIVPPTEIPSVLATGPSNTGPIFSDSFFSALIAPVFFSIIEQDLAQRCFAAKTKRVATISALLAALFLLVFALVPIILGMYAKTQGIVPGPGESPLVLLFQAKLSPFGLTIVACALLAAICSTADSLLGAASTNLIADFLPSKGSFSLPVARLLTLLLGIVALIIAFNFNDVIDIIIKSYEVSICALFIPLVFAMYANKPSKLGAQLAIALGIVTYIIFNAVKIPSPTLFALAFSGISFFIGSLMEKRGNKTA